MSVVGTAKGCVLPLFCLLSFESIPHFEFVSYFLCISPTWSYGICFNIYTLLGVASVRT